MTKAQFLQTLLKVREENSGQTRRGAEALRRWGAPFVGRFQDTQKDPKGSWPSFPIHFFSGFSCSTSRLCNFNFVCFPNQPRNWKSHLVQALLEIHSKVPDWAESRLTWHAGIWRKHRETSYRFTGSQVDSLFQLPKKILVPTSVESYAFWDLLVKEQTGWCHHQPLRPSCKWFHPL